MRHRAIELAADQATPKNEKESRDRPPRRQRIAAENFPIAQKCADFFRVRRREKQTPPRFRDGFVPSNQSTATSDLWTGRRRSNRISGLLRPPVRRIRPASA